MVLSRASSSVSGSVQGASSHMVLDPVFAQRYMREPLKRREFPEDELPRDAAFQIVADILQVDGKPRLNLASFVTTWMETEADKLMKMSLNKNAIDLAEYPAYAFIQEECVHMIARLFHAPLSESEEAVGTGTVGSSEAFMLAALAMKRRWSHFRTAKGEPKDNPNLVAAASAHVVIDKFCNYFDVELRKVPVTRECPFLRPERAVEMCDENTIGVVTVLGSTYSGHFDDVKGVCQALDSLHLPHGWQIPVHVDAASGGFVAPFLYPELEWDFRLSRVVSINASGHKYGLAYPGVGWVVWRNEEYLPPDLVFHVSYLGQDQPTFTLNFSKGAAHVVAQYYQFIRLGFNGYRRVIEHCAEVADRLRKALEDTGLFDIISNPNLGLPLVAFAFKTSGRASHISEHDLMDEIQRHHWIVPAYSMPLENGETLSMCRICVREELGSGLAEWLVTDINAAVTRLLKDHPASASETTEGKDESKGSEERPIQESGDKGKKIWSVVEGEEGKLEVRKGTFTVC